MSNSIFVPVRQSPSSLDEVRRAVVRAFVGFGMEQPTVQLHDATSPRKALAESFVTVSGDGVQEYCWISFGEYPMELTGADAVTHMAAVTTRGSWLFAAVVVLALFEFGGSTAFNDSGELDGLEEYDMETLRRAINAGLGAMPSP